MSDNDEQKLTKNEIKNEIKDLRKFLFSLQEKGEGFYTHVSQIIPTGRYNVTRKHIEEFWKIYCDNVFYNSKFISGS